jgi:hypothetical protein
LLLGLRRLSLLQVGELRVLGGVLLLLGGGFPGRGAARHVRDSADRRGPQERGSHSSSHHRDSPVLFAFCLRVGSLPVGGDLVRFLPR